MAVRMTGIPMTKFAAKLFLLYILFGSAAILCKSGAGSANNRQIRIQQAIVGKWSNEAPLENLLLIPAKNFPDKKPLGPLYLVETDEGGNPKNNASGNRKLSTIESAAIVIKLTELSPGKYYQLGHFEGGDSAKGAFFPARVKWNKNEYYLEGLYQEGGQAYIEMDGGTRYHLLRLAASITLKVQ